jgi:hypothetical protein
MGIGTDGAKSLILSLKAGTTTKQELRAEIGDALNVLHTKAAAMDTQMAGAAADFAAALPTEFQQHVDQLPDVGDTP